jgi:hypothetical protein
MFDNTFYSFSNELFIDNCCITIDHDHKTYDFKCIANRGFDIVIQTIYLYVSPFNFVAYPKKIVNWDHS